MNVAFEVSPLIAASSTFGDKSGVYRYTYGLIKAYIDFLKKEDPSGKVILFTFSPQLLINPLNPEILTLIQEENVVFIEGGHSSYDNRKLMQFLSHLYNIEQHAIYDIPPFKLFFKILFNFFLYKKIILNLTSQAKFQYHCDYLIREFRRYKVKTILHSDTSFASLPNFQNVIIIYDMTAVNMGYFHRKETVNLHMRKMKFARLHSDKLVVISESTKQDMLKYSRKLGMKKTQIIYPGLDESFNISEEEGLSSFTDLAFFINRKFKWDLQKNKYLLFYGTHEPRKNLNYLIGAFYQLDKEKKIPDDFRLILCGGEGWGKVKTNIKYFIEEHYPILEKRKVLMLDFLSDEYLVELIRNARGVVYPSLYEGFGLPIVESMSLGTPVLTSNVSSMPEAGGDAAIYVDPHDFYNLKSKMEELIHNDKIHNSLKKKSIDQAKKFSWKTGAEKFHQLIKIK